MNAWDSKSLSRSPDLAAEHANIRGLAPLELRQRLSALIRADSTELASLFYDALLADPRSAPYVDRAMVNRSLRQSMKRWLEQLFDPDVDSASLLDTQQRTGAVHARIGMPQTLVANAARVLRRAIVTRLEYSDLGREDLLPIALFVQEMFDLALDAMTTAFQTDSSRLARSEEAYRLFFLGQNMKAERERRRSELLEWAQVILDRYYWNATDSPAASDVSPFGLWMQHKAGILFDGAAELELIGREIHEIEGRLLPQLTQVRTDREDARTTVAEINRHINRIMDLLGSMFDRYLAVEDGRDSATALLNRRYFPAIARREIEVSQAMGRPFAVLMIDIDGFRRVADRADADAGNQLLHQVAVLLQEQTRAGDFAFRIGEDEFLILLVECALEQALHVAEALRLRAERTPFTQRVAMPVSMTLSIGVAQFDGHPDYQRLLERADEALVRAKRLGGNRVES